MRMEAIERLDDPRVAVYRNVRDPELRRARGLFLAEGSFVVRRLLSLAPERVRSLFLTPTALERLGDALAPLGHRVPVYLGTRAILSQVVGYRMHQGCLAAAERGGEPSPEALLGSLRSPLLLVLEDLANPDNVGALFRNAAAFGVGGVLLSPHCADPLSRKAIRVSMGEALRVPFAWAAPWPDGLAVLQRRGFARLALTPTPEGTDLLELGGAHPLPGRAALLVGSEGRGLSAAALDRCDLRVRIPMSRDVDSLNVASAAAIALHHLARTLAAGTSPASGSGHT
jgi:tRNA G18 (ribose-2'-O)-methylase SpoU